MNVVIVGAGQTGRYISSLLSKENHNVLLVDTNPLRLEQASWNTDIGIQEGSGVDWQLLDSLLDTSPELLVALTDDDSTNLVCCTTAKNLGYPRTIARVRDNRYLNRTRLDFGRLFNVDDFICPELLVANEIYKFMISSEALRVETFAHGAVQLRTVVIPSTWRKSNIPLSKLELPEGMMVGVIKRKDQGSHDYSDHEKSEIIFPHGNDCILPGDELTLVGETEVIGEVHSYFGVSQKTVRSVVIFGGSRTAVNLVKMLEGMDVSVRLIEKDRQKCLELAEVLQKSTIINEDGTNLDFLLSEKINQTDAFVVSTRSDELNVLAGLLAKEAGCDDIIIQLSNASYGPIVSRLGLGHTASPRIIAGNRILAKALSGTLTSLVSLYEDQAEVFEINVSNQSSITGIPISELGPHLPKNFLIAVIQNRGRVMIANGNRIISPGDTVILISDSKHRNELKKIF
ncbi:MAG: Trk system potassium uptake protein TrkA [Chlamydiae bacterium]|nr:Trk system potassium uptake protein TrkA [Chlamydiota bacterium]